MPELIDRQAAIRAIDDLLHCNIESEETYAIIGICKDAINEQPTIKEFDMFDDLALQIKAELQKAFPEPAEFTCVRHARWIPLENGGYCCSACGNKTDFERSEMIDYRDYPVYLDGYCGKCGARMDATDTNVGCKGGAENG